MLVQDPADYAPVFEAFGLPLDDEAIESLYPFAPVFRVALAPDVVLKRTCGPLEKARMLADWERDCLERGIPVVAPVADWPDNPRALDGEVWVIYPYLEGAPYAATDAQLRAAGELLGRMHADPDAPSMLAAKDWDASWAIEDDMDRLEDFPFRHDPEAADAIREVLTDWLASAPARLAWLSSLGLPEVDCSCDYKANNLVFTDDGPVLIDPDLGARQPRVVDLALACLLFHNEIAGGAGAMLDEDQWAAFLEGYGAHVTLSDAEREAWPEALRHVFLTHGLWLVFNEYDIDAPLQQAFMDDLLGFVLADDAYGL